MTAMTPERFRACLDALHWTQRGLARILSRPEGTVRQWARGAVRIPTDVAIWLDRLVLVHVMNPPPVREYWISIGLTNKQVCDIISKAEAGNYDKSLSLREFLEQEVDKAQQETRGIALVPRRDC